MLILEKALPLSSKMRTSVDHQKLGNFSQNHVKFYLKYASFVFKALRKPSFQKLLNWMLKKETIEKVRAFKRKPI